MGHVLFLFTGEIIAVVLVTCPLLRHRKMLIAGGGRIIREVATKAEEDARRAMNTHVRLRVVVQSKEKEKEKPITRKMMAWKKRVMRENN